MIPVSEPNLTASDIESVVSVLRDGWVSGEGPVVQEFERRFSRAVGLRHGVAVSSGTAAIDSLVAALDIQAGDEVIMPAFTIISCALQVVRLGAKPVLVDADAVHWNMQASLVEALISKRTRAVMAVHTYGLPVDMQALKNLQTQREFFLIEDAAEAHGLQVGDRFCGSLGDAGIFSFYSNKTLTTGEGGMVVTNSSEIADRVRSQRNLGFMKNERFVHEEMAWNFRMTSMQAALGISQLSRLSEAVEAKRQIGAWYRERLKDIPDLHLAPQEANGGLNTYWVFGMVLGDSYGDAPSVRKDLAERGIGTRPFFCPMHLQPVFQNLGLFRGEQHPVAERLWNKGLYLPSSLNLSEEVVDRVCRNVREVLRAR